MVRTIKEIKKGLPLKEQAYNYIKDKIIKCEFAPASEILESEIAEAMGISRTPVREALLKLSQEDLILIYPRKGMIVSPVSVKDIHEVFQIRSMVEPYAAIHGYKNMDKEILLGFKEGFENFIAQKDHKTYSDYFELDIGFHKYIVQSLKNDQLVHFMDKIYDMDYRIRVLSTLEEKDIEDRSKPEHLEIIQALLSQDEERIKEALLVHTHQALLAALRSI